jgi:hypothetical protein
MNLLHASSTPALLLPIRLHRVVLLSVAALLFAGTHATAEIAISIVSPTSTVHAFDVPLQVRVTSPIEITEVTATVEDRTVPLSFSLSLSQDLWLGEFPASRDGGTKELVIRATDALGGSATARMALQFVVLRWTFHEPLPGTVIRNDELRVDVSVETAEPQTYLEISNGNRGNWITYASGTNRVATTINVAQAPEGPFTVAAKSDSPLELNIFQPTPANSREVFIFRSPLFEEALTLPGPILELSDRFAVYEHHAPSTDFFAPSYTAVRVRNLPTGEDSFLHPAPVSTGPANDGVLIYNEGFYWEDGSTKVIPNLNIDSLLASAGRFIAWVTAEGNIWLRDLSGPENVRVAQEANRIKPHVTSGGEVVYSKGSTLYRFHNGTTTELTAASGATIIELGGSDEHLLIYAFGEVFQTASLLLLPEGAVQPEVLHEGPWSSTAAPPFLARDGWIAFRKQGVSTPQLWLRSPQGETRQLTFFGSESFLESLSASGTVTFSHNGKRYMAGMDVPRTELTPDFGTVQWRGDSLFLLLGRSAFRLKDAHLTLERSDTGWNLASKGTPGLSHLIEESTDLAHWTALPALTNNAPALKIEGNGASTRFFRARSMTSGAQP